MVTLLKSYSEPSVNKNEILRYAHSEKSDQINARLESLLNECLSQLSYRVCYCRLPIKAHYDSLDLYFATTFSKDLKKNLQNCKEIILFAATIGLPFDRLLAKYIRLSPLDGLLLQGIGTERIEALADAFEADLKSQLLQEGLRAMPRFSPGYGDLPLNLQTDIFHILDCPKNLGISLNSQLIMTPSKSITAIIGLKEIE